MTELLADRYELGRPLGAGGMAEVREGFDRLLTRRVAVKLLRRNAAGGSVRERFLREARAAASFSHPNAVAVFDVGQEAGQAFMVMELVEGESLAARLERDGPLPVDEAVRILSAALAALAAAHAAGLVHRDVKPANILLGPGGTVKLADFGIAKSMRAGAADLTAAGQILGTPRYLSPEQVAGQEATPASDVYAAGVVLYEMLAGRPPFDGDNPIAVALAHQREEPPPLTRLRGDLPAGLVALVDRTLAKDPAQRYPDAVALDAALTRFAGTEAVTVRVPAAPPAATLRMPREDAPARAGAPGRRTRTPWVVAGLAGLLLLAAAALAAGGGGADAPPAGPLPTGQAAPEPTATVPDGEEPPVTRTPEPTEVEVPTPETLPELVALLADDPRAYGEKGPDLLKGLRKVLDADDEQRAEEARKVMEDAAKWADEGELDPAVAALAVGLLEPLAAEQPPEATEGTDGTTEGRDENEPDKGSRGRGRDEPPGQTRQDG